MPASRPPIRAHPGKPFRTLADAAGDNQVMTIKCNLCRKKISFIASDLVAVVGPDWPVHIPPFGCSKCGKEYINVEFWRVQPEHLGRVAVRRPFKLVQKWRTEMLGDRR